MIAGLLLLLFSARDTTYSTFLSLPRGVEKIKIESSHKLNFIREGYLRNYRIGLFKVTGSKDEKLRVTSGVKKVRTGSSSLFENVLKKIVANPEEVYPVSFTELLGGPPSEPLPFQSGVKLFIRKQGIYRVYGNQLQSIGFPIHQVDPKYAKVYTRGREIPIFFQGEEDGSFDNLDYIEFYAEELRGKNSFYHPYGFENIYYLTFDGKLGARMVKTEFPEESEGLPYLKKFYKKIHLEKDSIFIPYMDMQMQNTDSFDLWFWKRFEIGKQETLTIELPAFSVQDTVTLTFSFETLEFSLTQNHTLLLKINGFLVDTIRWQTNAPVLRSVKVTGILNYGINTFVFEEQGEDVSLLNWIEIEGEVLPEVFQNKISLHYSPLDTMNIKFSGFRNPNLYFYQVPGKKFHQIQARDTLVDGELRYFIPAKISPIETGFYFITDTIFFPDSMKIYTEYGLWNPGSGSKILIISPRELLNKAEELAGFHRSQGWLVRVVPVEAIYDEFAWGIKSPSAIKNFLRYALLNWASPKPEVVLLFGDGSYDPRNIELRIPDHIPVYFIFTYNSQRGEYNAYPFSGPVSTDLYYAFLIGDDPFPDVIVSRLPINTTREADIFISKVKDYANNFGYWRVRSMAISDVEDVFHTANNIILQTVPSAYERTNMWHNKPHDVQDMIQEMSKGAVIVNFIAHGVPNYVSMMRGAEFRSKDWYGLKNYSKYFFLSVLSCWVGEFAGKSERFWGDKSFTEEVLLLPQKGAIGVYATSASAEFPNYSIGNPSFRLSQGVYEGFYKNKLTLLSEIYLFDKLFLLTYYPDVSWGQPRSMYFSSNLLSDPLVRLPLPETTTVNVSPTSLLSGDTLNIVSYTDVQSGTALEKISLKSEETSLSYWRAKSYSQIPYINQFEIPAFFNKGRGEVRIYFNNPGLPNKEAVGKSQFSIARANLDTIWFIPSYLDEDTFRVYSHISSTYPVDSVLLFWSEEDSLGGNPYVTLVEDLGGGNYRTLTPIGPIYAGNSFSLSFRVKGSSSITYTDTLTFKIPSLSDLLVKEALLSFEPLSKDTSTGLKIPVKNTGERETPDFRVLYFLMDSNQDTLFKGEDTLKLKGLSQSFISISIPDTLIKRKYLFFYSIDPDSVVEESDESNNQPIVPLTLINPYFTLIPGTDDTINVNDSLKVFISGDKVSSKSILKITRKEDIPNTQNEIELKEPHWEIISPIGSFGTSESLITITFPSSSQSYSPFNFKERDSLWHRLNFISDSLFLTGYSRDLGLFSLGEYLDSTGPSMDIYIDEEPITDGFKIKPNFKIKGVLSDISGVDIVDKKPVIELSGEDKSGEIVLNEGVQRPKQVAFHLPVKNLSEGNHNLKIRVRDCLGNETEKEWSFKVIVPFDIIYYGNFPNPATGEQTVIVIENTKNLTDIIAEVWTVSGRKIYTFDIFRADPVRYPVTRKGMHWLVWKLEDEKGRRVANGVYLLRIEGKYRNQTKEMIKKIAVLR